MSSELPPGWATTALSHIAEINPRHPKGLDDAILVTFVPMAALSQSKPSFQFTEERPLGRVRKGFTHFAEGDVLFAKITPCMENGKGAVARSLRNKLGCGTTELHVIRPLGDISSEYLYRFLAQNRVRRAAKENFTGTAGQARVPTSFIEELEVPLAPLPEQRRIVAKLEALLAKVGACQQRLAKIPLLLKRFRQSVLAAACSGRLSADWREENESAESAQTLLARTREARVQKWMDAKNAAGVKDSWRRRPRAAIYPEPAEHSGENLPETPAAWAWASLDELSFRLTYGITVGPEYVPTGVPMISAREIRSGEVAIGSANKISQPDYDALREKCRIYRNDVLFSKTGTIGSVARVKSDGPLCSSQNIAVISSLVESAFIEICLRSPDIQKHAADSVKDTAIPDLQLGIMARFPIPLPPVREQQEIVRRVEALFALADQIEARYTKAQQQVDKLTPSLLAKAFRGELVPQDPNDEPAEKLLRRIQDARRPAA